VTYDGNGSTGGNAPSDVTPHAQGVTVTVLGNTGTLVRTGYAFAGWNTKADGTGNSYAANATFTMGAADVTFYVVWIPSKLTFSSFGTTIRITGYQTAPTGPEALSIPSGVTEVNDGAFQGRTTLTEVTIPASVTSIGAQAFGSCSSLTGITVDPANPSYTSVSGILLDKNGATLLQVPGGMSGTYTIPFGVTRIEDFSLRGCSSLSTVIISSSVTSIGYLVLGESGVTAITIPAGVTSIADEAFMDTQALSVIAVDAGNPSYEAVNQVLFTKDGKTLVAAPGGIAGPYVVPDGVATISRGAFRECTGLTGISFPATGFTTIGYEAFSGCANLGGSVTIPGTVTSFGASAFSDCSSLGSVAINSGVPSIGTFTFWSCGNLATVTIPASVKSIGDGAFDWCSALTSVTISEGVKSVGSSAFYSCSKLTTVTLPSTITDIGTGAFNGCTLLATVNLNAITPPSLAASSGAFSNCAPGLKIHVPSVGTYLAAPGWPDYTTQLVSS
jgi:hypothetical protein